MGVEWGCMADGASEYLTPEQRARAEIDAQLEACGWAVQDYRSAAVREARGVAVREVPTDAGRADYVLFVDGQAVGVIEAKRVGATLTGVERQTRRYRAAFGGELPAFLVGEALPFGYESTGTETRFTCGLDPVPTSRRVFTFHRPETLAGWHDAHARWQGPQPHADGQTAQRDARSAAASGTTGRAGTDPALGHSATLRAGIRHLPELHTGRLWPAQAEAIRSLEMSLKANRPRALIQMATGSGKTFTAANVCYRLLRHAGAQRILFLVDRANLGRQAMAEFEGFETPDDGRKLTELYFARRLKSSDLDIAHEAAAKLHVSTIQRIYSILRAEDLDDDLDEQTGFDVAPQRPVEVVYSPRLPIESYDVIIVDECHRSIYGVWRQVLEYFDAFVIGLTATPGKQTFGFFHQNLVMEYGHEAAVADRVNVDFDVFRIRTEITEQGGTVPAELITEFRDRETRRQRFERIDEDIDYDPADLDRRVVAPHQICTIVRCLRDSMPLMFGDRERTDDGARLRHVPKTLIFAKDDSHADDIVRIVREEFGLSNTEAVKITYKNSDHHEALQAFRTSYVTRIAVTVDMIATGTDVKPIECVVFMRMVKSRNYFEQMKGRGVRVIDADALRGVTPDAVAKDRFVLVDAVGVTDAMLHDTVPLERKHSVSLDRLLNLVGLGVTEEDVVSSVASRLARLDARISDSDRAELQAVAGMSLSELAHRLVDALDPDSHLQAARADSGVDDPDRDQVEAARQRIVESALQPLAASADLREKLAEVQRSYEQVIDAASQDRVISSEFSEDAADRALAVTESFRQFVEDNRDEITALQIVYSRPSAGGGCSFADIKELANAIRRPPRGWTPDLLWQAYEILDASAVRGSGRRVLTDLVSLVRFALGFDDELVAYPELVDERFAAWLLQQRNAGRTFRPEQVAYLRLIKDHIAASLAIQRRDLTEPPFSSHGGLGRARQLFGADNVEPLLAELTETLAA